jgi:hypothetical protein
MLLATSVPNEGVVMRVLYLKDCLGYLVLKPVKLPGLLLLLFMFSWAFAFSALCRPSTQGSRLPMVLRFHIPEQSCLPDSAYYSHSTVYRFAQSWHL